MRLNIEDHDFEVKAKNARKFLTAGDKVKLTIMFRGREVTHPQIGERLCVKMGEELADIANIERQAKLEGRNMIMILTPKKEHELMKE
jgi:translation initiation factor IF-3